jgi:hypothetical protein
MKATTEISETLLDNAGFFKDDFFQRFHLRHAESPLDLNENISKNYLFPTFYGDVTSTISIFMCDYDKAQALLPHERMKPVKMTRGRSLVVFSSYEYKNVLGVAPYNEIAMTIPIMVDPKLNVPILPMITNGFKNFGYYVFSMPVNSLENQIRGRKIWGLPKVVEEIDIFEQQGSVVTIAKDSSGEPYLELRVPISGKKAAFDVRSNLYSGLDKKLLQSEMNFKGTYNVNKNFKTLFKKNQQTDQTYLKIGEGPSAQVLKDLEIEETPFQTRFAKHVTSSFDLPNPNFNSSIRFE